MIAAAVCAVVLPSSHAHACGGFFCSTAPVDQSGETVIYGLERDGTLTMSVEIEYEGQDDDFAWILPVPAVPEVSLGTPALFDALRAATQPVFVTDTRREGVCRAHPRCVRQDGSEIYDYGGCGFSGGGGGGGWSGEWVEIPDDAPGYDSGLSFPDAGAPGMGVTVFSKGPVGPYDTVVLGAATTQEVIDWLVLHDYDVPGDTQRLVDAYSDGGQIFVALRLSTSRLTSTLRPIVLRMQTSEACLPIRLTAIATVPDMPITALFLGQSRVVPLNYSSAEVATDDLAFWRGERLWTDAVSEVVDALDGQAFATDYSGRTPLVQVELPSVADLATETDPATVMRALARRGFQGDEVVLELLERFLEPPAGREPTDYYNCLATRDAPTCGSPLSFDPVGLATAIEAEIVVPRRDAQALIERHPHLTRLYTTMSAEDMTMDPVFIEDAGQPDVAAVRRAALVTDCSSSFYEEGAPTHWELGDTEIEERAGRTADDRSYCASLGGIPDYEAPAPEPEPMAMTRRGCGCGVERGAPLQGTALAVLLLVFLFRRARHN